MDAADPPDPVLKPITVEELLQRFEVLLLDAYGVLIHHGGALPGAAAFIERLNRERRRYLILTNDASRLPETTAARLARMGLAVPVERILSSGMLIGPYLEQQGLRGARCTVLGPQDSRLLAQRGGARLVPPHEEAEVLLVCDEAGFDFVELVDQVLSALFARLDRGRPVRLVLPNPDLIYPKSERGFGITAGSIAVILEAALRLRYPARSDLRFERLGKPNRPIFEAAAERLGCDPGDGKMVMLGDQLEIDIRGANDFGIPAVLVGSGLSSPADVAATGVRPSYLLQALA
jgi:HAD superfamily hydrolase (TIGR01450 family)